ncbi:MAG: PHP domain-containing protein, partial [Clostridia bacterium]|nr:PHP domain-containing protein [Clostridia bacterium]
GDDDSTPNNIAGKGAIAGLNIMALTDHNTTKNCPAFFAAAKKHGIIPIAGMELTTAEDIHVVCLFEHLDEAMRFDDEISGRHRIKVKNRVDIYGEQYIMDENDQVIGIEEFFLPISTDISIDDAVELCSAYNGVCFPAHIDRQANGIIATLGTVPPDLDFTIVEVHDIEKKDELLSSYPQLKDKRFVCCSDAHYLWDIRDKQAYFELEDEPYSSDLVRANLFKILREKR